jgi:hypothetical protein
MNQPYKKNCMYCNQEIMMSDETGKWLPYNNDGSSHDCKTKGKEAKAEVPFNQNSKDPGIVESLVRIYSRNGMTENKTEFTQSDINVLEHVLAKMKSIVKEKESQK